MAVPQDFLKELLRGVAEHDLARRIDYALLKPWATPSEVERAIDYTEKKGLRCLIVTPSLLKEVAGKTRCCVGAVAGFPMGINTLEAKIKEVEDLVSMGAKEIDFVMNYQKLVLGKEEFVKNEVKAVTSICRETGVKCKVIVELPAYADVRLAEQAVRLAAEAEPDFIKTSSGHGPRPTVPEDVVLVNRVLVEVGLRDRIGVKAAGGVRTAMQALILMRLGADVIGTSTPEQLLDGLNLLKRWYPEL